MSRNRFQTSQIFLASTIFLPESLFVFWFAVGPCIRVCIEFLLVGRQQNKLLLLLLLLSPKLLLLLSLLRSCKKPIFYVVLGHEKEIGLSTILNSSKPSYFQEKTVRSNTIKLKPENGEIKNLMFQGTPKSWVVLQQFF